MDVTLQHLQRRRADVPPRSSSDAHGSSSRSLPSRPLTSVEAYVSGAADIHAAGSTADSYYAAGGPRLETSHVLAAADAASLQDRIAAEQSELRREQAVLATMRSLPDVRSSLQAAGAPAVARPDRLPSASPAGTPAAPPALPALAWHMFPAPAPSSPSDASEAAAFVPSMPRLGAAAASADAGRSRLSTTTSSSSSGRVLAGAIPAVATQRPGVGVSTSSAAALAYVAAGSPSQEAAGATPRTAAAAAASPLSAVAAGLTVVTGSDHGISTGSASQWYLSAGGTVATSGASTDSPTRIATSAAVAASTWQAVAGYAASVSPTHAAVAAAGSAHTALDADGAGSGGGSPSHAAAAASASRGRRDAPPVGSPRSPQTLLPRSSRPLSPLRTVPPSPLRVVPASTLTVSPTSVLPTAPQAPSPTHALGANGLVHAPAAAAAASAAAQYLMQQRSPHHRHGDAGAGDHVQVVAAAAIPGAAAAASPRHGVSTSSLYSSGASIAVPLGVATPPLRGVCSPASTPAEHIVSPVVERAQQRSAADRAMRGLVADVSAAVRGEIRADTSFPDRSPLAASSSSSTTAGSTVAGMLQGATTGVDSSLYWRAAVSAGGQADGGLSSTGREEEAFVSIMARLDAWAVTHDAAVADIVS